VKKFNVVSQQRILYMTVGVRSAVN